MELKTYSFSFSNILLTLTYFIFNVASSSKVWYQAVTQSFFSLSVGFGALINYSSHNKFRHNVYRDALIISVTDTFTSLLAGFTIFAILGNLAKELDVPIDKVIKSGTGLAFVSYPMAIAKFEHGPQVSFQSKTEAIGN